MTIRIVRNTSGNCVNFVGTDQPAYWNACLTAEVNGDDDTKINIINDFRSQDPANLKYEFFGVGFEEFEDRDGNTFTDAATCAEYINVSSKVVGADQVGTDMTGVTVDFRLDQTSTSIIMSTGDAYGVNTIKAVAHTDGTIHINAIGEGIPTGTEDPHDLVLVEKLEVGNVKVNGTVVAGGLNDIVNTLNELFTVGAFEAVVISDPFSTMVADVGGITEGFSLVGSTAMDPSGSDIFTNSSSGNYAGLKSTGTIDQAGEYFTFDIRGEGQIGFGLVHSLDSYNAGKYQGNSTYADPAQFAVGNSAHFGFQFSHWFHQTPNGSWTNYGASTGYVAGTGWSNWDKKQDWLDGNPVKMRVGIDENGFIAISSQSDTAGEWILHARSSYPVPQGAEFHLGVKIANNSARVATEPYSHLLEPAAPVMNFRWIESPDGTFVWPLFATAEEAEYYDKVVNGNDPSQSHTHTYADDPTNTTWYMPEASHDPSTYHHAGAPINPTFNGQPVTYTAITSLSNADLTPTSYSSGNLTYQEGTNINLQVTPAGATWSTAVTITPAGSGLVYDGYSLIQGTLADVASDTDYTIEVTRSNAYGSSVGSSVITVTDVPPPQTNNTPWTKALDFSGGSEFLQNNQNANWASPMHPQNGSNVALPSSPVNVGTSAGNTSNDSNARPWATAVVFKPDYYNSNQHIWNFGEGASSWQKNTYLRLDANRGLYFGYNTVDGSSSKNECYIGSLGFTNDWFGVYIGFNGARFGSPTAANNMQAFDIRVGSSGGYAGQGAWDFSTMFSNQWGSTQSSLYNSTPGMGSARLTIGGRQNNRSFHGKVASFVTTTLKRNVAMPDTTEIEMMVKDPVNWMATYKQDETYRTPSSSGETTNWTVGSTTSYNNNGASTQVYLMGDGTNDSYNNGIRNQVNPGITHYRMVLNSMVSNDIQSVNIPGLT